MYLVKKEVIFMNKRIVLCGSMKVKDKILEVKDCLEKKGYEVLLPKECLEGLPKNIASRKHFEKIIDSNNEKVLIVNETKDGIENYIGPNTLAEISCAFYFNKKIYLLNDYYIPYLDELVGWGTINLKGNLDKIDEK